MELRGIAGKRRIATTGAMFGEMAIMGLSPDGKRLRSSKALTVVELCELSKENFAEVLTVRPSFFNIVRKSCMQHIAWLEQAYEETRGSVGLSGWSARRRSRIRAETPLAGARVVAARRSPGRALGSVGRRASTA